MRQCRFPELNRSVATLKAMIDDGKCDRITFACNKGATYSYHNVLRFLNAACSEIGKATTFKSGNVDGHSMHMGRVAEKLRQELAFLHLAVEKGYADGLRPPVKHREKVENWPIPTTRAELDAFLWLTPSLRICIPGRAAHVLEMKKAKTS